MKSEVFQGPATGSVSTFINWSLNRFSHTMAAIMNDRDQMNMLATMFLLLVFSLGWLYTSQSPDKRPKFLKVERKVEESKKTMNTIMDTLHLIKYAHENKFVCEERVNQHLASCIGYQPDDSDVQEVCETDYEETIVPMSHENQIHPDCDQSPPDSPFLTPPMSIVRKHEWIVSETEPDCSDLSSVNAENSATCCDLSRSNSLSPRRKQPSKLPRMQSTSK